jgi:hypothetical protein
VVPEGETGGEGDADAQSDIELLPLCDVEPDIESEGEFEVVVVSEGTREGVSGCVVPTADAVTPIEPLTEAVVEGEVLATSDGETVPERQSVWLPVGVSESVPLEDGDGEAEPHTEADAD